MSKPLNLTGQRFGALVVIGRADNDPSGKTRWWCQCDCGELKVILATSLVRGLTRSCGCFNKSVASKRMRKHLLSGHRLYGIWTDMKKRCSNPSCKSFDNYGGRGIKVCPAWENHFQLFYTWSLLNGYSDNLSLDRIDVNGDYHPDNCRWVDRVTQANNCRTNHYLTYQGERKTIAEWARVLGMSDAVIRTRISKLGWSTEKALSTPVRKSFKKRCATYKKNDCYFVGGDL